MFAFCDRLKMIRIDTRTIKASMMKMFSFGYLSVFQYIIIAVGHISTSRFSFPMMTRKVNCKSCISISFNKSSPLPTTIGKNFVMIMEILNSILFLKSRQARLAFIPFQYVVNAFCGTMKKQSQLWPIYPCFVFKDDLMFLLICKHSFWHNRHYIGMGA